MSPQEARIAIAEFVGWKITNGRSAVAPDGVRHDFLRWESVVPDYLNDLNAMHEAEKALGRDVLVCAFTKALEDVIKNGCRVADFSTYPSDMIWHATAAQRAEAFLRTINKWDDSK